MTSPRMDQFFRLLWNLNIMLKRKHFLWKLWHNSFATLAIFLGEVLEGLKIVLKEAEDCQHLFRNGPLALEACQLRDLGPTDYAPQLLLFADWLVHHILSYS